MSNVCPLLKWRASSIDQVIYSLWFNVALTLFFIYLIKMLGLCAFSNNNFNHFIITLDPCDAFNTKYTIFGEVSEDTVPSLISINTCEVFYYLLKIYIIFSKNYLFYRQMKKYKEISI